MLRRHLDHLEYLESEAIQVMRAIHTSEGPLDEAFCPPSVTLVLHSSRKQHRMLSF
ncbi:MAG: hypothetical protein SFV15_00865 [Polyangiaceae bacterium]|nr:hypothetical protein [Polyangiaceae bacterium]